ncbi:MAG: hypothetical protein AB7I38_17750 [Dehalococcoidia bacterium]
MSDKELPDPGTSADDATSAQGDRQDTGTEAGPGTELAIAPWPSTLNGREHQPGTRALTTMLAHGHAAVGELRFATQRPPSLRDQLAYARSGEWTEDTGGTRRHLMHGYVLLVAIPLTTAAYLVAWAAARPARLATTTALTTLICTALNTIPGLRLLVPDWTTWPHWPPLSWIF